MLLLTLWWVPLQAVRSDGPALTVSDPDAYEVYSTILPLEWPIRHAHAKQPLVLNETRTYRMCLRPGPESDSRIAPAIADYLKVNDKTWLFDRKFHIEDDYDLISSQQIKSALGDGQWDKFHERYPNSRGWIELSAVGFNPDKTVAVVYMGHYCGPLCGGGGFYVLEKKDGKWVYLELKGESCAWAS